MEYERTPQDRLFLTYARTFTVESARELANNDAEVRQNFDVDEVIAHVDQLRSVSPTEFRAVYRTLAPTLAPAVRSYQLMFYLHHQQHSITVYDLEQLEAEIDICPGDRVLDQLLLQCLRGHLKVRGGEIQEAAQLMEHELSQLDRNPGSLYGEYLRALLHRNLGLAHQHRGDFPASQRHLEEASRITRAHQFLLELSCNWFLGSLQWASGQFRDALLTHQNQELRELCARTENANQLIHSHVSAAKCAIDLKETDTAEEELRCAREIVRTGSGSWPELEGYILLYSGELAVQREQLELGIELLKSAQAHFEEMDPQHYPGILDAKIALSHFALYERNYGAAMGMIRLLMEEANQYGCLEARSRLLLIEAFFFITEDPPRRHAYDDLLTRVHLIHNPTLLFRALGNLYTYSLEFLDEQDQAFILDRLRNLEASLTTDCYRDLYQRYVTERYEYAIENRLARYVEADWIYWGDEPEE